MVEDNGVSPLFVLDGTAVVDSNFKPLVLTYHFI